MRWTNSGAFSGAVAGTLRLGALGALRGRFRKEGVAESVGTAAVGENVEYEETENTGAG